MHRHALTKVTPIGGHSVTFPCSNGEQVYYRDRTKCIDGARFQPIQKSINNPGLLRQPFIDLPIQSSTNLPIQYKSANPMPILYQSAQTSPIHQFDANPGRTCQSITTPGLQFHAFANLPIHEQYASQTNLTIQHSTNTRPIPEYSSRQTITHPLHTSNSRIGTHWHRPPQSKVKIP